jgi:hypothetical protein
VCSHKAGNAMAAYTVYAADGGSLTRRIQRSPESPDIPMHRPSSSTHTSLLAKLSFSSQKLAIFQFRSRLLIEKAASSELPLSSGPRMWGVVLTKRRYPSRKCRHPPGHAL